ncbi:MAG: Mut7-C RNAse domain-containing protein [Gammaproteobacteria bacterium]|nr:Mut7-C RNAse domain-containing protein [Gammaproteobacteria bacterium]
MSDNTYQFLCDEMLTGLGRWLRIAGFDTELVTPGTPDKEVAQIAKSTNRIFLTCDSPLAKRLKNKPEVLLLSSSDVDSCVAELNQKLPINWSANAFTRCSVCNHEIHLATENEINSLRIDLSNNGPVYYCKYCDKLYWEGSHVKRMRNRLKKFQTLSAQ